ncbi:MAG: FAD-dependent oxidoreductase, partial [Eggerthellaceae bacterium]|nr:FAD-dependent oxidoreductase [Eggerthellaceae bacterium]
ERPGGLLMYGIPNMKLPKWVVERRCKLMEESGIEFLCNVDAVEKAKTIAGESVAVVVACGSRTPRHLDVPGSNLDGVHFAVEYLAETTRALLDGREASITAHGKDVVVIGGGDTGVDCVATALRQGAHSIRQVVRAARPPQSTDVQEAWPGPRSIYTQAYGQLETEELMGQDPRMWSTDTVGFVDNGSGHVAAVQVRARGVQEIRSATHSDNVRELPAQLVLIAKGFTGPQQQVIDAFDTFGNVYLAGDARLGSTLVATAMADALQVAEQIAHKMFF